MCSNNPAAAEEVILCLIEMHAASKSLGCPCLFPQQLSEHLTHLQYRQTCKRNATTEFALELTVH